MRFEDILRSSIEMLLFSDKREICKETGPKNKSMYLSEFLNVSIRIKIYLTRNFAVKHHEYFQKSRLVKRLTSSKYPRTIP